MQALLTTDAILVESYVGPSDERSLADDVLDGLTRPFKELPPKHFYDAVGAELFDQICELPEYYATRAERAILETGSADIVAATGAAELVELGSGTAAKTRLLLRGTDLVKDPAILEAAYDDSAGITARFNRNVLHVVNRELDADFDVEAFDHVAFFDRERQWIEMRLRAQRRMDVHVRKLGLQVAFAPREELRTEISAKFTVDRLRGDLAAAGLELQEMLTDPDGLFALSLSSPR